ncbi:MAG: ligand-binding SRPBCC domain-containing protein [Planctomycetota bacterium]|jgi:ligand-binding SRPBCC domain-containing protein
MKKQIFTYKSQLSCSAEELYQWHAQPECFELLTPDWANTTLLSQEGTIEEEGSRAHLKMKMGPIPRSWIAEHYDCIPNKQFCDRQIVGPFSLWEHQHLFEANDEGVVLHDRIHFVLPGWWFGQIFGGRFTKKKLLRLFEYRHHQTAQHLGATMTHLGSSCEPES